VRCEICGKRLPITVPLHRRIEIKEENGKKIAYPSTNDICQCNERKYDRYIRGAAKKWNKWNNLSDEEKRRREEEAKRWLES